MIKRVVGILAASFAAILLTATLASAGSAHFVGGISITRTGDSLTAAGKIAGLGDEDQVHVILSATAACINPGGNPPSAGNKQTVTAGDDVPVQNGKAIFELTVTAVFKPSCTPPMTLVYSDVSVTDETSGISVSVPGTF